MKESEIHVKKVLNVSRATQPICFVQVHLGNIWHFLKSKFINTVLKSDGGSDLNHKKRRFTPSHFCF